ncbi:hypothetical protein ANO11243_094850 [Dothideomycetidae sp. 11243]|nr:hypothetical protein ANO11243_094850 [fungal sp. No.11243]
MASPESLTTIRSRHDSLLSTSSESKPLLRSAGPGLFDLPAELRTTIYSLVFNTSDTYTDAFHSSPSSDALVLNPSYAASTHLAPLLTCRQFHSDAHLLALSRVLFVVSNPYLALSLSARLSSLLSAQAISSIRHIAIVADARHLRLLRSWSCSPFGIPSLSLSRLSIVLHRSSYWHYLFDFNVSLVSLLGCLHGVERLDIVRNDALVKGTLLTWYNRFIKLLLDTDRKERVRGVPELRWWAWEHCAEEQTVSLFARPPKNRHLDLRRYDEAMAPLYLELRLSIESEEEDPDPMSRVSPG